MSNLECQVLRIERETLKSFFRHGMNTLCNKFYSRRLILQDQVEMGGKNEEKQVNSLILMLENQVQLKSESFYVIVGCLKEIGGMSNVAEKLEQTLQALKAEHAKNVAQLKMREKTREERPVYLSCHKESTVRGDITTSGPAMYKNSTPQQIPFKGHYSVGSEMNLLPPPGTYTPNNSFYQSPQSEVVTSTTHEKQVLYLHHYHQPTAAKRHCHHHTHTEKRPANIATSRESSAEECATLLDLPDQTETEHNNNDGTPESSKDDVRSPSITMITTTEESRGEEEEKETIKKSEQIEEGAYFVWGNNEKPAAATIATPSSSSEENYATPPISPLPNTSSPLSSPGFPTKETVTPSGYNTSCGIATSSRRSSTDKCEKCFSLRHKISLLEEEVKKIQKRENLEKLASREQVESMRRELNNTIQLQQRHQEQAAIISYLQIKVGLLQSRDKERVERERVLTEDLSRERTLRKREREEKEKQRSQMEETLLRANESSERRLRIKEEMIQSLLQGLSRANSLQCGSHQSLLQLSAYPWQQNPPHGYPQCGNPLPAGLPQYNPPPPAGYYPPPAGLPQYNHPPPAGYYPPPDGHSQYPQTPYPHPPPVSSQAAADSTTAQAVVGEIPPPNNTRIITLTKIFD